MPKDMEEAIRMPRDAEVIDSLKRVSAEGALPARSVESPPKTRDLISWDSRSRVEKLCLLEYAGITLEGHYA